jgi:hypothetical protein
VTRKVVFATFFIGRQQQQQQQHKLKERNIEIKATMSAEAEETKTENAPPSPESPTGQDSTDNKKEVNSNVQNSFSADSPYYKSYVENEMKSMQIMNETLKDIAARTKTFGKCGALMSESTRRLALACRLRRPYVVDEEKNADEVERQHEMEVAERRKAVGDDMASLLSVMSEVCDNRLCSIETSVDFHTNFY